VLLLISAGVGLWALLSVFAVALCVAAGRGDAATVAAAPAAEPDAFAPRHVRFERSRAA
jgi:hypothetical protein